MTQLPFGGINPQSQPLGPFVQPLRRNLAEPGRPSLLPQVRGISTLQQAQTANVGGSNAWSEISDALGPLNKNLSGMFQRALKQNATDRIDAGYQAEAANQAARAARKLQLQREMGAAEAAAEIQRLEKEDPVASQLLKETNPWNAIGRRRYLAQLAAGQIGTQLQAVRAERPELISYAPGSPQLMQAKAEATQGVLDRFGLTGSELEAQYYVAPALNKAWDKFTAQHAKDYAAETTRVQGELGRAQLLQMGYRMATDGITLPNGEVVRLGDPRFDTLAGALLTKQLDGTLALMPQSRAKTVKEVREYLSKTLGVAYPGMVGAIRGGDPRLDMEKRPTWGDAYSPELISMSAEGLAQQNKLTTQRQATLNDQAQTDFNTSVRSQQPGTQEYAQAYNEWQQRWSAQGLQGVDALGQKLTNELYDSTRIVTAYDAETAAQIEQEIVNAPSAAFSGDGAYIENRVKALAAMEPDPLKRAELRSRLYGLAARRRDELSKVPVGFSPQINGEVRQDLALGDITSMKGGNQMTNLATLLQGAGPSQLAAASGNHKIQVFANDLRNLYVRAASEAVRGFRDQNNREPSAGELNVLISGAVAKVRSSPEYTRVYKEATGKNPGEVGEGVVGPGRVGEGEPIGTPTKPVPQSQDNFDALTDDQVRNGETVRLMKGSAVIAEMKALKANSEFTPEFTGLAGRGNVNPYKLLRHQIELYAQPDGSNPLDPTGKWVQFLLQLEKKQRERASLTTTAGPVLVGAAPYRPTQPGGWLTSMLFGGAA